MGSNLIPNFETTVLTAHYNEKGKFLKVIEKFINKTSDRNIYKQNMWTDKYHLAFTSPLWMSEGYFAIIYFLLDLLLFK